MMSRQLQTSHQKKDFINAKYETLLNLFMRYAKQERLHFANPDCTISICGINSQNKITASTLYTLNLKYESIEPVDERHIISVFCNRGSYEITQQIGAIVDVKPIKEVVLEIQEIIRNKRYADGDETINAYLNIEHLVKNSMI